MTDEAAGPSLIGVARARSASAARRMRPGRRDWAVALMILAATPVSAALVTRLAATIEGRRAATLERRIAPRIAAVATARAAAAEADRLAPLLARPTITSLAARLGRVLPPGAHVAALGVDDEGVIAAEIDCTDPDALTDALATDPLLARLRPVGQRPAAADGVRVQLATPRP